jgi:hypothetical protein
MDFTNVKRDVERDQEGKRKANLDSASPESSSEL